MHIPFRCLTMEKGVKVLRIKELNRFTIDRRAIVQLSAAFTLLLIFEEKIPKIKESELSSHPTVKQVQANPIAPVIGVDLNADC